MVPPLRGLLGTAGLGLGDSLVSVDGALLLCDQRLKAVQPLGLHTLGQLVALRRGRAGARGILERIGLSVAHRADQIERRLEIRLLLAREAHDEIAGQQQLRPGHPQPVDAGHQHRGKALLMGKGPAGFQAVDQSC